MLRLRQKPSLGLWPTRSILHQRLAYIYMHILSGCLPCRYGLKYWIPLKSNFDPPMICVWQCAVNTFLLWGIVHEHCSPRAENNVLYYFFSDVRCSENVLLSSLCGWVALLVTAGVMGEGVGEFNVNSLNRSLHASNICAISFPINLDSCRLSPFHAGREYITHIFLKYLYSQFVFHSTHSWMFWLLQGPPDL